MEQYMPFRRPRRGRISPIRRKQGVSVAETSVEKITAAANGLLMMSETDAPFTPFAWDAATPFNTNLSLRSLKRLLSRST